MTNEQRRVLEAFFDSKLPPQWRTLSFVYLDGMQTLEVLWPMNDLFRPHHAQIGSLLYDPNLELDADDAIERFAFGEQWTTASPPPGVWRVLLERHLQAQTAALANHVSGNAQVVPLPAALPPGDHKVAAVLFLHYAMKLPFSVEERAHHQWPAAFQPGNLQRH